MSKQKEILSPDSNISKLLNGNIDSMISFSNSLVSDKTKLNNSIKKYATVLAKFNGIVSSPNPNMQSILDKKPTVDYDDPFPLELELIEETKVLDKKNGSWYTKKLKTMEMRRDFLQNELDAVSDIDADKSYEDKRNKIAQLDFYIAEFKQKQADLSAKQADKPEDVLFKKLQNYRNIFLMSKKSDEDFKLYSEAITNETAKITALQPELFQVKRVFSEYLSKDIEQVGKDQLQVFKDFQEMIRLYDGGKGALTKETYFNYLKSNVETGKSSKVGSLQLIGQQSQFLINQDDAAKQKQEQAAQDEIDRNWQQYKRYELNVSQLQNRIALNANSLKEDSLKKALDANELEYEGFKENVAFQIQDEKTRNEVIAELNRQKAETALLIEYQYTQKHNAMFAGLQSAFGTFWDKFVVGSRQAKNASDAVWLSFRNAALNSIGNEVSSELMKKLFKKDAKPSADAKDSSGNFLNDVLSFITTILPFLADGAVVTKPTLALIGEAGPEAVIPLDQMNNQKIIYVQPVIQGKFDVSMHKLNLKLAQNKKMMEALY